MSAPLEVRVTASLASRAQQAVLLALRLGREVNDTLHREEVGERASEALGVVTRPGGLPFVVFVLLVAVLATRELLLRTETRRILRRRGLQLYCHNPPCCTSPSMRLGLPQNGGSAAFNKRSTYPRAVQGKKRILVVLFSPFDAKNELNFWNYGEIARDFGGSPIKWVESVVRSSALLSTT